MVMRWSWLHEGVGERRRDTTLGRETSHVPPAAVTQKQLYLESRMVSYVIKINI